MEDILGLDGGEVSTNNLAIPAENFRHVDLRSGFNLDRRFSLVQSLEVAEHLPKSCATDFVSYLTLHGDIVLFSAAIPGQGGYRHINEQRLSYWIRIFSKFGFLAKDIIRPYGWHNREVSVWYRQNTLVFIHESRGFEFKSHLRLASVTPESFDLVHPDLFQSKVEHPEDWASASGFPIRELVLGLCKAVPRTAKRIFSFGATAIKAENSGSVLPSLTHENVDQPQVYGRGLRR